MTKIIELNKSEIKVIKNILEKRGNPTVCGMCYGKLLYAKVSIECSTKKGETFYIKIEDDE